MPYLHVEMSWIPPLVIAAVVSIAMIPVTDREILEAREARRVLWARVRRLRGGL